MYGEINSYIYLVSNVQQMYDKLNKNFGGHCDPTIDRYDKKSIINFKTLNFKTVYN